MSDFNDTRTTILELIRNKELTTEQLIQALNQYHESDIADVLPMLSDEEKDEFFSKLSNDQLGELLTYVDSPEEYIEELDPSKAADIVETMDADDAVDVLEDVDEDVLQDILEEMEEEQREDIELIHKFEDDEIGSKITTNYITIKKNFSIKEAMRTLVSEAPENDNINNLFVLDDDSTYYGTIMLKDLIIAREGTSILDITKTNYPTLYAHDKVEDVINEIKDIDLDIIPVLAENDTIMGVITSQDIIETVDEELAEDYVKFAAVAEDADVDDTLLQSVKRRVPWLAMLLLLDILTSSVLSGFEGLFTLLPALVLFQSWILDSSGNAGTQSLALTIRAITNDELNKDTFVKRMVKELFTGLLDGLLVGMAGFIISFLFLLITKNPVNGGEVEITNQLIAAGIVGGSLFCAIPITSLAGLFIPIIFKKIHIDPAVASGPLITTLSDMCGVAIYYGLATVLFSTLL